MWEAATRWKFKAAAHGTGSSRLLDGETPVDRAPSPSAAQHSSVSSPRRLDGPGAAGGQIASPHQQAGSGKGDGGKPKIKGCEVWRQLLALSLDCCSFLLPQAKPGCADHRCAWFGGIRRLQCLCAQDPVHTRGKGLGKGRGGDVRIVGHGLGGG